MNTKNTYVNDFPDSRSSVADSHRSAMLGTVDADDQYVVIARRFGVLAVMLIFIACYLYGIAIYGVVLGVGLGWLPSGLIAWLAVLSIGFGINRMRRNQ